MYIINFIKSHQTNWREALTAPPYCLTIKEDDDLVLLKYSQLVSDFSEPIVREARGLILEKGTWKVVRHAFDKFFNYGETFAPKMNWSSSSLNVTEKMDGTLVSLYWYKNKWRIATNSNLSAYSSPLNVGGYSTFGDLATATLDKMGLKYENLNKEWTWTFEICSPFNQVVCYYDDLCAWLIGIRDNESGKEIDPMMFAEQISVPAAKSWNVSSLEDCQNIVKSLSDNQEGIVVWDKELGVRLKMKTELYFNLHRTISNHKLSSRRIYDLIMKNETDEFLAYFPAYKETIEEHRKILEEKIKFYFYINLIIMLWKVRHPAAARTDFMAWGKAHLDWENYSTIYWFAYDNMLLKRMNEVKDVYQLMRFYKL